MTKTKLRHEKNMAFVMKYKKHHQSSAIRKRQRDDGSTSSLSPLEKKHKQDNGKVSTVSSNPQTVEEDDDDDCIFGNEKETVDEQDKEGEEVNTRVQNGASDDGTTKHGQFKQTNTERLKRAKRKSTKQKKSGVLETSNSFRGRLNLVKHKRELLDVILALSETVKTLGTLVMAVANKHNCNTNGNLIAQGAVDVKTKPENGLMRYTKELWRWSRKFDMQQATHFGDSTIKNCWKRLKDAKDFKTFMNSSDLVDIAACLRVQYHSFTGKVNRT